MCVIWLGWFVCWFVLVGFLWYLVGFVLVVWLLVCCGRFGSVVDGFVFGLFFCC